MRKKILSFFQWNSSSPHKNVFILFHSLPEFASSCCKQFQSHFWKTFLLRRYVSISHENFSRWIKKANLVWRFKNRTPVTDTVRTEVILTTLRRVIQCEYFIKDESASLVVYASLYDLNMCILKTKGSTKRTCALPDTKSHSKTTLWKIRSHVTQTSEIPYFEG